MNKIDECLLKAQFKANSIIDPSNEKVQKGAKHLRTGIIVANVMVMMLALGSMVFAATDAGQQIADKVSGGLQSVYGVITAICVPIAIIAAAFAVFQFFFGGEKGVQTAKKTLIYVAIGIAGIYFMPLIVQAVSNWFSDASNGTDSVWNQRV